MKKIKYNDNRDKLIQFVKILEVGLTSKTELATILPKISQKLNKLQILSKFNKLDSIDDKPHSTYMQRG